MQCRILQQDSVLCCIICIICILCICISKTRKLLNENLNLQSDVNAITLVEVYVLNVALPDSCYAR